MATLGTFRVRTFSSVRQDTDKRWWSLFERVIIMKHSVMCIKHTDACASSRQCSQAVVKASIHTFHSGSTAQVTLMLLSTATQVLLQIDKSAYIDQGQLQKGHHE